MRIFRRRRKAETGPDLGWIDGFISSIRPHVYVRERDSLLIRMPNRSYRLNETGIKLLKPALEGKPIGDVLDGILPRAQQTDQVRQDVHEFFCDLRAVMKGCAGSCRDRRAVEFESFRWEPNMLPVLSEIALTYRCNLSCKFCYAGCDCKAGPSSDEMTTEQVKSVLHSIRYDAEVPSVSFTGGEPTLRKDLPELVEHATGIGMRVNLITNGTLMNGALAASLKSAGLKSAQVSIEGPDAGVHDGLVGMAGAFERAVGAIGFLREQGIHVHHNTTINGLNVSEVEGMVDLAVSLELPRFSMNMVMPCGTATRDDGVALKYSEIGPIVKRVRDRAREKGIEFMWYSPTPYCLFNPVASGLGSKACAACDGLLSVTPSGNVIPCSSLSEPVGNILEEDFDTVWNTRKARFYRMREHAPDLCRSCSRFDICGGACPIYWEAFGTSELDASAAHS